MKYTKELHDKLRNRTGLHIFNHQIGLDSEDIDTLLDEIERLQMAISRMKEAGENLIQLANFNNKKAVYYTETWSALMKELK